MSASQPARYTAADLRAQATRRGSPVSSRLITDWVEKGLLNRPQVRGLGRGKGTLATWPEEQLRLFLLLLDKRTKIKRAATLCNLPVAIWMIYGEQYVPLRQVRRALATWAEAYTTVKHGRAERTALQLLDQVAHPDAEESDKLDFELLISKAAKTGSIDLGKLERVARKVVDPHRTGVTRGEFGMLETDAVVHTIDFRVTGLANLQVPDEVYEQARQLYRATRPEIQPPSLGRMALDAVVAEACLDLITLIGMTIRTPPNTKT